METGHPSTRAVNSGRQLGQWKHGLTYRDKTEALPSKRRKESEQCDEKYDDADYTHEVRWSVKERRQTFTDGIESQRPHVYQVPATY